MIDYRTGLRSLAWRLVPAALLIRAGWILIAKAHGGFAATPQLLAAMLLFIIAAVLLAFPLASVVVEPFMSYLRPDRPLDKPVPVYGIPEALRKRGRIEEAFEGFRAIAMKYPQELKAYVEMIDIAIRELRNPGLAEAVLQQGRAALESEQDREALERMHVAIRSRLDTPPPPPQPHLKPPAP